MKRRQVAHSEWFKCLNYIEHLNQIIIKNMVVFFLLSRLFLTDALNVACKLSLCVDSIRSLT